MKRWLSAAVLTLAVWIVAPTPAIFADAVAPLTTAGQSHTLVLTPVQWTIITGLIMPFVLALITKASSSSVFKGVMGILVAALAAVIERATLADGSAVFTSGLLLDIGLVYGPQLMTYLGLWSKVDLNGKIAPKLGLG